VEEEYPNATKNKEKAMKRVITEHGYVQSGLSYCFRDMEAALDASKRVTTNPKVVPIYERDYPYTERYLGYAGTFIKPDGNRYDRYIGKRNEFIRLIEEMWA